jgi:hypothetical protein
MDTRAIGKPAVFVGAPRTGGPRAAFSKINVFQCIVKNDEFDEFGELASLENRIIDGET